MWIHFVQRQAEQLRSSGRQVAVALEVERRACMIGLVVVAPFVDHLAARPESDIERSPGDPGEATQLLVKHEGKEGVGQPFRVDEFQAVFAAGGRFRR